MKPILMNPSDTLTQMTSSQTNGLGRLNAQRCVVTEERNGIYEAELTVFIDDEHFSSLSVGSVLKLMTNEGLQMFRVYQITKPINGVCSVYAHHITYDLAKAPVMPFTATGATNVVNGLVSHMASTYEFTMITDIVNALSVFTLTEPKYFRECLGGYQGSILDVFGGEYEWDNTTVKLLAHRGSDNGVQIRYGKNLTDIQQETNIESMYDAVIGYATVDETTTTGTIQMITQVSSPKTMLVDFSNQFESGDTVTVEKLNTLALNYIQTHDMTAPRVSIDVSFVALASTDQYKDIAPLEHVKLCDTVHVLFEKLGVNASAKVIKTEYDSLNERLLSVEIGDAKSNMTDVINDTVANAEAEQIRAVNAVDGAVGNLTNMILNSLGLFVSKVEKSGGGYQYYMHNRPELSDSQYQWTINAGGFAVSQDYGQTWTAGIDADGNAVFNSIAANVINAMEIHGSLIEGSKFYSGLGDFSLELWAAVYTMYYKNYVRTVLGGSRTESYVRFLTGSATSGNVAPADGILTNITAHGITLFNSSNEALARLYFGDTGDVRIDSYGGEITLARGNNSVKISDTGIALANLNTNTSINLDNSTGLGIFINGSGYNGLGFVNDGNGHAVIGK